LRTKTQADLMESEVLHKDKEIKRLKRLLGDSLAELQELKVAN